MTPGFWLIVAMVIVAVIAAASLVGPLVDEIRSIMGLRREAADLATELDNERNDHERTREALAQVSAALVETRAELAQAHAEVRLLTEAGEKVREKTAQVIAFRRSGNAS